MRSLIIGLLISSFLGIATAPISAQADDVETIVVEGVRVPLSWQEIMGYYGMFGSNAPVLAAVSWSWSGFKAAIKSGVNTSIPCSEGALSSTDGINRAVAATRVLQPQLQGLTRFILHGEVFTMNYPDGGREDYMFNAYSGAVAAIDGSLILGSNPSACG